MRDFICNEVSNIKYTVDQIKKIKEWNKTDILFKMGYFRCLSSSYKGHFYTHIGINLCFSSLICTTTLKKYTMYTASELFVPASNFHPNRRKQCASNKTSEYNAEV